MLPQMTVVFLSLISHQSLSLFPCMDPRRVEFQREPSLAIIVHHLVLPSEVPLRQMFMSKFKLIITWQSLTYIKLNSTCSYWESTHIFKSLSPKIKYIYI